MMKCHIDIETRSSVSIDYGVDMYVSAPDFKIIMLAYAIDDGPVIHHDLAKFKVPFPEEVKVILKDDNITKVAHNAVFEIVCLQKELNIELNLYAWECTMVKCLVAGLPGGLGKACKALKLEEQKSHTNHISWFCKPAKKSMLGSQVECYRDPREHIYKWLEFVEYNKQDVEAERGLDKALGDIPWEKELWVADFFINRRGVAVDKDLIEGCIKLDSQNTETIKKKIQDKYHIDNPNSVKQLKEYLSLIYGLDYDSLAKREIENLLLSDGLPPEVRELFTLRQQMAGTATKKYSTMLSWTGQDGRIRGMFRFYGANRTGRWAGSGPQPQNLYRSYLAYEDLKYARELVNLGDDPRLVDDMPGDILSQLTRTVFVGNLTIIDFSSIECRVLAWLAGETWVNNVFASHGKIYEAQASKMYGVPIEKVTKDLRSKGKIATLALGYQGSIGALEQMGYDGFGKEDIVNKYREANKKIVGFWRQMELGFKSCIENGGDICIRGLWIKRERKWITIQLPSWRKLYYYNPFMDKHKIHYWGKGGHGFEVQQTYGGKLVENVTQAIARDILAVNLLRLRDRKVVMHIHDEIVVEDMSLKELKMVVEKPIEWAEGLIIKADGFETDFYMKEA